MKEIDLVVGLEPLREEEVRETDGGIAPLIAGAIVVGKWLLGACAVAIATEVVLNPSNTAEQFKEGYDAARK
ncbi:MAG: hypothetical protein PUJ69_06780 [Porphyromonas somerae]|uniref:hypothetical protein n=1 Tax=Porphyromonas somerae TaxID=322095 RepID=UPI0026F13EE7|nr:hypothetical protein [Porphyromonas somerae]MDD7558359.1 hypothetical protein [Porphyromonas somerae]MDY3885340.1 hypothetical protein [Porphyromonas somerae]MDY5815939.1 hypothetical protein [Porphyromonas somerae]